MRAIVPVVVARSRTTLIAAILGLGLLAMATALLGMAFRQLRHGQAEALRGVAAVQAAEGASTQAVALPMTIARGEQVSVAAAGQDFLLRLEWSREPEEGSGQQTPQVIFRYDPGGRFYVLSIEADGRVLLSEAGGAMPTEALAWSRMEAASDTRYQVELSCVGPEIRVTVNGGVALLYRDPDPLRGTVIVVEARDGSIALEGLQTLGQSGAVATGDACCAE